MTHFKKNSIQSYVLFHEKDVDVGVID